MKTLIFSLITTCLLMSCQNNNLKKDTSILGDWDAHLSHNGKPYVLKAHFGSDNSYDGFTDGKLFVTGKYTIDGDVMTISDSLCNEQYEGKYKIAFFAQDSLRFSVIEDTCKMRNQGINGLAVKKLQ